MSALFAGMKGQNLRTLAAPSLYTGIDTYVHSAPSLLSDGHICTSGGFLMAGYQPVAGSVTNNLFIERTDIDGNFNSTAPEFHNEYALLAGSLPCSGTPANVSKCYGVSVLEVNYPTTQSYAVAAAFDDGVLFSFLKNTGVPNSVGQQFFQFPPQITAASKPLIARSTNSPTQFFIAGAYLLNGTWFMYVMHVTQSGGIAWNKLYTLGSNSEVIPRAIMVSPYAAISNPELVVIGQCNNNNALNEQGFFARLDDNTGGNVLQFDTYGSNTPANEQFWSLAKSNMPGAMQGYAIGGYCNVNPTFGTTWMVKVDPNGNIIWSSLIQPSMAFPAKFVGVVERFSTTYGQYEYYGAAEGNNGMTVIKIDAASGNLFNQPGNPLNEFIYNDNSGGQSIAAAITSINNGGLNDGIHVYGTNNSVPGMGDQFLVRACFNGAAGNSGCSATNIHVSTLPSAFRIPGPTQIVPQTVGINNGPVSCTNFGFTSVNALVTVNNPCDATALPTAPVVGDQSRPQLTTGISEPGNTTAGLSVSPNPVSDKLSINFTATEDARVTITLTNQLGQVVMQPLTTTGGNSLELDLDKMNLKSGIYFVGISINGLSSTRKIVYAK